MPAADTKPAPAMSWAQRAAAPSSSTRAPPVDVKDVAASPIVKAAATVANAPNVAPSPSAPAASLMSHNAVPHTVVPPTTPTTGGKSTTPSLATAFVWFTGMTPEECKAALKRDADAVELLCKCVVRTRPIHVSVSHVYQHKKDCPATARLPKCGLCGGHHPQPLCNIRVCAPCGHAHGHLPGEPHICQWPARCCLLRAGVPQVAPVVPQVAPAVPQVQSAAVNDDDDGDASPHKRHRRRGGRNRRGK